MCLCVRAGSGREGRSGILAGPYECLIPPYTRGGGTLRMGWEMFFFQEKEWVQAVCVCVCVRAPQRSGSFASARSCLHSSCAPIRLTRLGTILTNLFKSYHHWEMLLEFPVFYGTSFLLQGVSVYLDCSYERHCSLRSTFGYSVDLSSYPSPPTFRSVSSIQYYVLSLYL